LRPADAAQLRAEAYQDFKNCTSSKYRGVSRVARGWCATAGDCFVGVWHSEEKAAKAHDQALLFLGRATEKTNFPARRLAGVSPSELRKEAYRDRKGRSRIHTSRYVGVSYNPANGGRAWNASLTADGKQHNLGYWKNEMDAARVHDRAVLFYKTEGVPLNFPDEGNPPASAATLRAESFREGKARYSSSFRGVHYDKENQCWKASITYRFRSIWLGRFADEREAALAFDARAIALRGLNARLNFDPGTSEPVWGKRLRELSDLPERDG
jgi:hypothetical protein